MKTEINGEESMDDNDFVDTENCKPGDSDYYNNSRRERFGNNRKKVKKSVKRKRAQIAKKSRRRNRA